MVNTDINVDPPRIAPDPPSVDRRELEMEVLEALEHPGGRVLEPAVTGGAVVGFRESDILHPIEDPLQGDVRLGPGERCSGTGVDAVTERDVLSPVQPVQPQVRRALEL